MYYKKLALVALLVLFASPAFAADWFTNDGMKCNTISPGQTCFALIDTTVPTSIINAVQCGRWSYFQKDGDTSTTVTSQRCFDFNTGTCANDVSVSDLGPAAWDYHYVWGGQLRGVPASATADRLKYVCVGW